MYIVLASTSTSLGDLPVESLTPRRSQAGLAGLVGARAEQCGGYDELIECEMTGYLSKQSRTFDVIVCADTLCYFGN